MTEEDIKKRPRFFIVKTTIIVIIMMAVGLMSASKSQAQSVRDKTGQAYFERAAATLCGPKVHVTFSSDRAYVYVSDDFLENRNLTEATLNLALDDLNDFPDCRSFYLDVH